MIPITLESTQGLATKKFPHKYVWRLCTDKPIQLALKTGSVQATMGWHESIFWDAVLIFTCKHRICVVD